MDAGSPGCCSQAVASLGYTNLGASGPCNLSLQGEPPPCQARLSSQGASPASSQLRVVLPKPATGVTTFCLFHVDWPCALGTSIGQDWEGEHPAAGHEVNRQLGDRWPVGQVMSTGHSRDMLHACSHTSITAMASRASQILKSRSGGLRDLELLR